MRTAILLPDTFFIYADKIKKYSASFFSLFGIILRHIPLYFTKKGADSEELPLFSIVIDSITVR